MLPGLIGRTIAFEAIRSRFDSVGGNKNVVAPLDSATANLWATFLFTLVSFHKQKPDMELYNPSNKKRKLIRIARELGYAWVSVSIPGAPPGSGEKWEITFARGFLENVVEKGLEQALLETSEVQQVLDEPDISETTIKLIKSTFK